MDAIQKELLEQVAGLHEIPTGAYNIRANGQADGRRSTANIEIVSKTDKAGIDIFIKENTKNEDKVPYNFYSRCARGFHACCLRRFQGSR